jgi:hypothetical protein
MRKFGRFSLYEKNGTVMICREGKVVSPQEIGMDTVEIRKHFNSTGIGTNVPRQVVTLIKRRLIRLSK